MKVKQRTDTANEGKKDRENAIEKLSEIRNKIKRRNFKICSFF